MHADAASHAPPYLLAAIVLLAAGLMAAPLCRRVGLSPVVGYLLAGLALGPGGFDLAPGGKAIAQIAELGVIFLLFAIGLELSLERLKAMGRLVFGLGGAQMAITTLLVGSIAFAWGHAPAAAVVLGLCFGFSSTAVAMQLLAERRETGSPHGRVGFAILLLQDIAVAPALLIVLVLGAGPQSPGELALAFGFAGLKGVVAVLLIVVVGRLVLAPLFRIIAAERSPELFMAAAILAALLTAWATDAAGLSTALGAFLAGVLLAETPYRTQIEADIEPFRGILLGLFFMGVGLGLDPRMVADAWPMALLSVAGLAAMKAGVIYGLVRLWGRGRSEAVRVAFLLAQAGEFGFVILGVAAVSGVVDGPVVQFMGLVIAASMLASPLLDLLGRNLARWLDRGRPASAAAAGAVGHEPPRVDHVVIAGFGRTGQIVAAALDAHGATWVAVDRDPSVAAAAAADGRPVIFGDAGRADLLGRLGLGGAAALVVTLDDAVAAERAILAARALTPALPIFARARDERTAEALAALGARDVLPESLEPSLHLAQNALSALGAPPAQTLDTLEAMRAAARARRGGAK